MNLADIQSALTAAGLDGWLFCDFHHRDPMAYDILGLDMSKKTSRRWFYYIPATGEPTKLAHNVEPGKLNSLPGEQRHYSAWTELHAQLKSILSGGPKIAMQYSPMNDIPYVSVVDGGTLELVRSCGAEVASSAGLVQQFQAVTDAAGYRSHCEAGKLVQQIKDEAYAKLEAGVGRVTEFEVAQFILARFEEEGMTAGGAVPIVGFNDHPADPHFEPTAENSHTLQAGDTILIDLWARKKQPVGIYYDVTWCGFAGSNPPAEYVKMFDVVMRARDAALQFVRDKFSAGDPCHGWEVDDACRQVVQQAGYGEAFVHRTGHNIGTEVHGNGANIDNLETRDTRAIVPGTCFSIEPGIYLTGRMGVRSEIDVFVTTDAKVEVYGPIQQELILFG